MNGVERTRGPKDHKTKGQRTKGPEELGTRGPEDQRTKGPKDQGPKDQRTRGPED